MRPRRAHSPAPDQAEVKVYVASEDVPRALQKLHLHRSDAEQREIVFFDTPRARRIERGQILRVRVDDDGGVESTVKLRPADPSQLPRDVTEASGFKLESERGVDPRRRTISASIDQQQKKGELDQVLEGDRPVEKLFSRRQRVLAGIGAPLRFERLEAFGPFSSYVWSVGKARGAKIGAELWKLPHGIRVLELSAKTAPGDVAAVRGAMLGILSRAGVHVDPTPSSKTEVALDALRD